jgi:urease accessory protein UreF
MRPSDKNAFGSPTEAEFAWSKAENLLGDFSALLEQLGVRGGQAGCDVSVAQPSAPIDNLSALQSFLDGYLTDILLPLELPAIAAACGLVRRGEARELMELDHRLAGEAHFIPFANASRRIGAIQLQRLKPLRDERTVQRYLSAVKTGEANGWHTLVYGLTLAVFSFPLRQGLLHYSRETVTALTRAAAGLQKFQEPACQEMLCGYLIRLPEAVEQTIAKDPTSIAPLQKYS